MRGYSVQAIALKSYAPELALVLNKQSDPFYVLGIFLPSSWKLSHMFPIPKREQI